MKAPKYVIYTDHKADWNNKDEYIECAETNFIDVFEKAAEILRNDSTIYLVRIYEVVKGTRSKEYKRIANVRPDNYIKKTDADTITRHNQYNTVWFE